MITELFDPPLPSSIQVAHHGMIYVPAKSVDGMGGNDTVRGGVCGSSVYSVPCPMDGPLGPPSRLPMDGCLQLATHLSPVKDYLA